MAAAVEETHDLLLHLVHAAPEDTLLACEDAGSGQEKLTTQERQSAAMSAAIETFSYDVHVMLGIKVSRRGCGP